MIYKSNIKIRFLFIMGWMMFFAFTFSGQIVPKALGATYVGSRITSGTTWNVANSPYILTANIEVNRCTLTIESGTEVECGGYYLYTDYGTINATGATFTGTGSGKIRVNTGGSATLTDCSLQGDGGSYGVTNNRGALNMTGCYVSNFQTGVYITGSGASAVCRNNNFFGNSLYAINNTTSVAVDALYCWWGDESGPSGQGQGTGDPVSEYVDFDPWLEEYYLPQIGFINGIVSNAVTNEPIIDALVVATGGYVDTSTDTDGFFNILGVPEGSGYSVTAYAAGYQSNSYEPVTVQGGQVTKEINIELQPIVTPIDYTVVDLVPDPNDRDGDGTPDDSEVMQGGTVYRYYKVIESFTEVPTPKIPVRIEYPDGSLDEIESDKDGVVTIPIHVGSGNVNDTPTLRVVSVNGKDLSETIDFTVKVVEREYSTSWNINKHGAVSAIIPVTPQAEGGVEVAIQGTEDDERTLEISRYLFAGIGKGIGAEIGISADISVNGMNFSKGSYAGAGADVTALSEHRTGYRFDYPDSSLTHSLAEFALMNRGIVGGISPVLLGSLLYIERNFTENNVLQDAYLYGGCGVVRKGAGWAEAQLSSDLLGLGVSSFLKTDIDVSVGGEVSAESRQIEYHENGEYFTAASYNVGAEIGGELGMNFSTVSWLPNTDNYFAQYLPDFFDFFNNQGKYTIVGSFIIGGGIEIWKDSDGLPIKIILKIYTDSGTNREEITTYIITVQSSDQEAMTNLVNQLKTTLDAVSALSSSLTSAGSYSVVVNSALLPQTIKTLFTKIGSIQDTAQSVYRNLDVTWEKYKEVLSEKTEPFAFDFKIGAIKFNGGINYSHTITESKNILISRGKFVKGRFYTVEKYTPDTFTNDRQITLEGIYQQINDNISDYLTGAFEDISTSITQAGQETVIMIGNAVITVAADALPSFTQLLSNAWGWYGETSASSKFLLSLEAVEKTEQIKGIAQEDAGLKFGIGGFYQIDPDGLPLAVPSLIEITYEDSEIDGFDENELSVYRWNKNTGKWEFIGGSVDADNNKATATINKLGTFTLAPKIAYNTFNLVPADISIPADGSSTTTITSGTILYNDGSVVDDGTLITIEADKGTLLATDADSDIEGLQVATFDGVISFEIKSGYVASKVGTYASSVAGEAHSSCMVTFTDSSIPDAPTITMVRPGDEKITVRWEGPSDPDIAGYKVYYDTDSGEPYEGEATIFGSPSPIDVGPMNVWEITGLSNGQIYYIAVTAYDVAYNESSYSNEVSSIPSSCEGDFDNDGDVDGSDLAVFAADFGRTDCASPPSCEGDFDGDDDVDGSDLAVFAADFGRTDCQ